MEKIERNTPIGPSNSLSGTSFHRDGPNSIDSYPVWMTHRNVDWILLMVVVAATMVMMMSSVAPFSDHDQYYYYDY
jgi:uncharacterized membrane protein YfcA